ncbi:MAG: transposase [Moraxellaceae bacterium]|jgi:hypothetical protein|nr:transposase [Moraxellaceae bacterium]
MTKSPWVERFAGLDCREALRRKVARRPEVFIADRKLSEDEIATGMKDALMQIYLPSEQALTTMQRFIRSARHYCRQQFSGTKAFLEKVYETPPPADDTFPTCVTGPAGVGKSAFLRALMTAMPSPQDIEVGSGHGSFFTQAAWGVHVRPQQQSLDLLRQLLRSPGEADTKPSHEVAKKLVLKKAIRQGIALIIVDELQFMAKGDNATSRISTTIQDFASINPPMIYAANFSMVHKLLRQAPQFTQRFLSNPVVIEADEPCSEDWILYLEECRRVAGGCLEIDPDRDAWEIFNYTAGLKRLVIDLFHLAYLSARQSGRQSVRLPDLDAAYRSRSYAAYRRTVEITRRQEIEGRCLDEDYWCPFEGADRKGSRAVQWRRWEEERFAQKLIDAQSTLHELKERGADKKQQAKSGTEPVPARAEASPPPARKEKGQEVFDDFKRRNSYASRSKKKSN